MIPAVMSWYYSKMGLQQGPVPEDELKTKIRRGEIDGTNLVWKEGMAEWKPLSQVPGLMAPAQIVSDPLSPPEVSLEQPLQEFSSPGQGGNVPLPQPPAYYGNYVAPHIPSHMVASIVVLVLSCISMLIICIPIGLPFAIVAVVFATKVDSLKVQGDVVAAQAASRNAKIWMIIAYVMAALPILGMAAIFLFAALSSI